MANVLGFDVGAHGTKEAQRTPEQDAARARVRALLGGWLRSGGLRRAQEHSARLGRDVPIITVGTAAVLLQDPDPDGDMAGQEALPHSELSEEAD